MLHKILTPSGKSCSHTKPQIFFIQFNYLMLLLLFQLFVPNWIMLLVLLTVGNGLIWTEPNHEMWLNGLNSSVQFRFNG